MWIQNKSSYLTVKQQAKHWKKLDRITKRSLLNLDEYLQQKREKQNVTLIQVHIPKLHTSIYNSPFYIVKTGYHSIMQYNQDGTIKSRKSLPASLRLISISRKWFTAKFGEPI